MTTTTTEVTLRELFPEEGKWLYKDDDDERIFSKHVFLGKEADLNEWQECTNAEKEQWESKVNASQEFSETLD